LSAESTKHIIKNNFNLSQTIFTVAGKYDFDAIVSILDSRFSILDTSIQHPASSIPYPASSRYTHINSDSAQVHIGLMTETVKPTDEDYYNARMAVSVLSGGMSARLFTEVREKKGLCYAVAAQYHTLRVPARRGPKDAAGIMCYAGTTPEKAKVTLDCIIGEFNRLSEEITDEEITRAKVGLKSSLILQSESSSSRAGAIGSDYYILGRVRSLDEIKDKIEKTSVDSVLKFLRDNKFKDFTVVTIGPTQLIID